MPHPWIAPISFFILEFSLKSPQCFLNIPMAFPNHPWEYYDLGFVDTNKATPGRSRVHSLRLTCTNAAATCRMNIEEWAPEDSGSPKGYRQPIPQSIAFQNRDCLCSGDREGWEMLSLVQTLGFRHYSLAFFLTTFPLIKDLLTRCYFPP